MNNIKSILLELGLSSEWLTHDFYDEADTVAFYREKLDSTDPHLEHFRWKLFKSFWSKYAASDSKDYPLLLQLIEKEEDAGLRSAMLFEVIDAEDISNEILESYSQSEFNSIRNKASKKLRQRLG